MITQNMNHTDTRSRIIDNSTGKSQMDMSLKVRIVEDVQKW
jgi:hypothetical protein